MMVGRTNNIGFYQLISHLAIVLICIFINQIANAQYSKTTSKIYLNIHLKDATDRDTLTIYVGDNMLSNLNGPGSGDERRRYTKSLKNGSFRFEIPVRNSSGYFDITKNSINGHISQNTSVMVMQPQYWEANDSLTVYLTFGKAQLGGNGSAKYTGRGSVKYNLANIFQHSLVDQDSLSKQIAVKEPWDGNILQSPNFDDLSSDIKIRLKILDMSKDSITTDAYNVLKANLIYSFHISSLNRITRVASQGKFKSLESGVKSLMINKFDTAFDDPNNYGISDQYLRNSLGFMLFLDRKIRAKCVIVNSKYIPEWIYGAIKAYHISHEIKETMLMAVLNNSMIQVNNLAFFYGDAEGYIKNPMYLDKLQKLRRRMPGEKFVDFELEDLQGKKTSLADFKDKVVVLDFWLTGCGGCQYYYKNVLSEVERAFSGDRNVVFLSISIDRKKSLWQKTVSEGLLTSNRAVNLYTNGMAANHPIITTNNISEYPFVMLLDKQSKINLVNTADLKEIDVMISSIKKLL